MVKLDVFHYYLGTEKVKIKWGYLEAGTRGAVPNHNQISCGSYLTQVPVELHVAGSFRYQNSSREGNSVSQSHFV